MVTLEYRGHRVTLKAGIWRGPEVVVEDLAVLHPDLLPGRDRLAHVPDQDKALADVAVALLGARIVKYTPPPAPPAGAVA